MPPYNSKKSGAAAAAAKASSTLASTSTPSTSTTEPRPSRDTSTPQGLAQALDDCGAIRLSPKSKLQERTIQSLWANYGKITELELEVDDDEEERDWGARRTKRTTLIVKRVCPPPSTTATGSGAGDRDDGDDIGHRRKLESYVAEAAFYEHCARRTIEGGAAIARPLLVSTSDAVDKSRENPPLSSPSPPPPRFSLTLVLADLRGEFPVFARGSLRPEQLRAALRWLARFHAIWWGCKGGSSSIGSDVGGEENNNNDNQLSLPAELANREGTFWYLDTRPDEWEAIPDDESFLSGLKEEAAGIAADLKAEAEKFPVLVHGDAKAANFAFSATPLNVGDSAAAAVSAAAYDFQYVGKGVGARDVAYLLSSAGSSSSSSSRGDRDRCRELEASLDFYYEALAADLASLDKGDVLATYTREVLRDHFRLATADFYRFMAGWGTWGGGASRAERIAREVVEERRRRRGR